MSLSPALAGGFFTNNTNIMLFIYLDVQIAVVLAFGGSINWHLLLILHLNIPLLF